MKSAVGTVVLGVACLLGASAFAPPSSSGSGRRGLAPSSPLHSEAATAESAAATIETDPKEAVKLFGRLAEKYISEWPFDT